MHALFILDQKSEQTMQNHALKNKKLYLTNQ
jgi:hypothetical protein